MRSPDVSILAALRAAPLHLSGAELAERAGVSPQGLAERVCGLREAGFEIELHPGLGFRLRGEPDRLIADDLWSRFRAGEPPVREMVVLEETGSTNDVATRLGRQGEAGGLLVLAETQTAGRGRFGRQWVSAAHRGVWMSLLLRPSLPVEQWPRLTTWAAAGVAAAFDRVAGTRTAIKWPNDLQVDGRKVAGILIEMGTDGAQRPFAVVGIGVNANHEAGDFPPELRETAQSLRMATGRALRRPELLVAMLEELHARTLALEGDFPSLVAEAERRSSLLGRWIQVRAGGTLLAGVAEELDADGHLLLREGSGEVRTLTAGEVTLQVG